MPDYDEIAARFGGTSSDGGAAEDKYAAAARKFGGTVAGAGPATGGGERNLSSLITGKAPRLSRMEKFKRGVMDPIDGGAQLLANALPKGLVDAGNRLNNWLADNTGLVARLPEGGVDQLVRQGQADYERRRGASGETGFDGYRALGGFAATVPLAAATGGAGVGAGLSTRVAIGATQGAAAGSLVPVTGDDYWAEKREQIGTGAAFGGVAAPVLGGLARVISPNASRNANLQLLRREGVTPTVGQALGGTAGRVEEKLQSLPIVGDAINAARGRAAGDFQEAAVNRALAPIGQKLPPGVSGRAAIEHAENTLRQSYDDVLSRIGAIPADQQFSTQVANLQQMVGRDVLSKQAKQKFGMVLNDVQSAFNNGVLTSEGFKRVESQLGSDFRKLTSSQDIYDGRLAPAVQQLQAELRDLLQRQAGQHADDLAATNAGWANFKRVQRAAGALGAEGGEFTPAQFQSAVKALDRSKDKGAFARGGALGQDLGDAGRSVLTGKVADSGTAGRAMLGVGALGSSYLLNPAMAAGMLGGAGLYLSPAQRALVAAVASRPAAAQPAADALRKAGPMLIPGLSQLPLY